MSLKRAILVLALATVITTVVGCLPPGPDAGEAPAASGYSTAASGQGAGASGSAALAVREPYATRTPMALATPDAQSEPGAESASATPTPVPEESTEPAVEVQEDEPAAEPADDAAVGATAADDTADPVVVALPRVEDVDPAPPIAVSVDGVWLVGGGASYRVTGRVRNDGDEQLEAIGLEATFYDGSEWHFGPFDATVGCYSLAPGQTCAFSVDAYAREYTAYRLHPEGSPVKAWTASSTGLTVTEAVVTGQAGGCVHLTGAVTNQTASLVTAVRVSVELLTDDGVSGAASTVLTGDLAPGAEMPFSVRVPAASYTSYAVTAEAELR